MVMVFGKGEVVLAEFWKSENRERFWLRSRNQQFYDKMDGATGFNSSNRSRKYLSQIFWL